jgi:flap endonuclease-1
MGIKGLSKLLGDEAPNCVKEQAIDALFGRKIAIDASMAIYQFLIAVRQGADQLTNAAGETTSHLTGIFYRTIKLLEAGVKPCYVFDGKPPEFKSGELLKRREKAQEASAELKKAKDAGDTENIEKFAKRTVRATKQDTEDVIRLLQLMGIPVIRAASEAEATAALMTKWGLVYGVGTEDMDAMTFGAVRQIRNLHKSEAAKQPILEFNVGFALQEMDITMDQFIDICILCGCDYSDSIRGIGPKKAFEYIKRYKNIETLLKNIDTSKNPPPDPFDFENCRRLFKDPEVTSREECEAALKWKAPDEEGLLKFLAEEKGFDPQRVKNGIARIKKSKSKGSQGRLDSFFKVTAKMPTSKKRASLEKGKKGSKKKKTGPYAGR